VKRVIEGERRIMPGDSRLSEAVARYLFKLMAYKDEYEVARLSLKREVHVVLVNQFGSQAAVRYHLHPPFLRALGVKKKIKFGGWFKMVYRLLSAMRRLRGTAFDVFGLAKVRRIERHLITQYRRLIEVALDDLSPDNYAQAVKLASLPDLIRGYEAIKLRNIQRFWEEVGKISEAWPVMREQAKTRG
jgi:indolepyruvate ferredoxin oxidoreductase